MPAQDSNCATFRASACALAMRRP